MEPPQPARPGGNGLAHHRAEPEPQPRLPQGRRAGDARDAAPGAGVGSAGDGRPARHQRRAVRTRHLVPGRTAARRRPGASRHRPAVARRGDRRRAAPRLPAPAVLSLVRRPGRSGLGLRGRRGAATLLARVFPVAQPPRHAGGDALLEALSRARADHPQRDRVGARADGAPRRAVAAHGAGGRCARRAAGRPGRTPSLEGFQPGAHHRLPRLRLHPHAL